MPITEGLLAGFKVRAMMEDMRMTRAQRLRFEADAAHDEAMNTLEEQRGQAELNLTGLQGQMQQMLLEESKATAGTRKAKGEADLASTLADVDYKKALGNESVTRIKGAELDNQGKALALAGTAGKAAAFTGQEFTAEDIQSLVGNTVNTLGVKAKPGDPTWQFYTNQILGGLKEAQMELDDNREKVGMYRQTRQQEQAVNLAMAASQLGQDPVGMIDIALKNKLVDEGTAALAKGFIERGGLSPQGVLAAEARQTPDDAFTKDIKEQLAATYSAITSLTAKEESEGLAKPGFFGGEDEAKTLKQAKAKAKSLEKQLEEYLGSKAKPRSRKKDFTDITEPEARTTGFGNTALDLGEKMPEPTTEAEVLKLPKGTTYRWVDGKLYRKN